MRYFAITGFHLRIVSIKIALVVVFFPIFLVLFPWWAMRGEADWRSLGSMFNPAEWADSMGYFAEVGFGCRWYLVEVKQNIEGCNIPYSYYDDEIDLLGFLFLEDAVLANMSYGGRIVNRKSCKKIMR